MEGLRSVKVSSPILEERASRPESFTPVQAWPAAPVLLAPALVPPVVACAPALDLIATAVACAPNSKLPPVKSSNAFLVLEEDDLAVGLAAQLQAHRNLGHRGVADVGALGIEPGPSRARRRCRSRPCRWSGTRHSRSCCRKNLALWPAPRNTLMVSE